MEEKSSKSDCREFEKCIEILNLMLDNEANDDEVAYLDGHLEKCMVCFEYYKVEKQIRELIRTKIKYHHVPENLAAEIRTRIFSRA